MKHADLSTIPMIGAVLLCSKLNQNDANGVTHRKKSKDFGFKKYKNKLSRIRGEYRLLYFAQLNSL